MRSENCDVLGGIQASQIFQASGVVKQNFKLIQDIVLVAIIVTDLTIMLLCSRSSKSIPSDILFIW